MAGKVKFTLPVEIPTDPTPTPKSAATIGNINKALADLVEPPVDLTVLLENNLI
jgi:hypothetical protein